MTDKQIIELAKEAGFGKILLLEHANNIAMFRKFAQLSARQGEAIGYIVPDYAEVFKQRDNRTLMVKDKTDLHSLAVYLSPQPTQDKDAEIARLREALTKIINIELKDMLGGNTAQEYSVNSNHAYHMQRLANQALNQGDNNG
jgi:hypothetical protein